MDGAGRAIPPEPSESRYREDGSLVREAWALPLEEAFLEAFLRDLFENHWSGIRFGPMIQGAAYEWKCPGAPERISLFDGYLTVMFGNGGHFHLCIGENRGSSASPTGPALRAHRRPSRAEIFRGFDRDAKPLTWGFELWNGRARTASPFSFQARSSTMTTPSPLLPTSAGSQPGAPSRRDGSAARRKRSTRRARASPGPDTEASAGNAVVLSR